MYEPYPIGEAVPVLDPPNLTAGPGDALCFIVFLWQVYYCIFWLPGVWYMELYSSICWSLYYFMFIENKQLYLLKLPNLTISYSLKNDFNFSTRNSQAVIMCILFQLKEKGIKPKEVSLKTPIRFSSMQIVLCLNSWNFLSLLVQFLVRSNLLGGTCSLV